MEAILMEYAASESRLEILLGVIGLPCNKFLDNKERKDIKIFSRIECSNYIFNNSKIFEKSKLNKKFFYNLEKWEKNEMNIFTSYIKMKLCIAKEFATKGYEYCNALYNEVNCVKNFHKKYQEFHDDLIKRKKIVNYMK